MVPNQLLKQRYRILKKVGGGGFGIVYQAEDTLFRNRPVAVKEMIQNGQSQQQVKEAVEAFQREAHMLANLDHQNLDHQNLPKIYDYFEDAGQWYLVMDFIEGETLTDFLNLEDLDKTKVKKLLLEEVLDIGIQLCTILCYLHTCQPPIIIRDLKPDNIMRKPDGHLYLIDFGIARHFKPEQKNTAALGTLGYAAVEQIGKNPRATPLSDIYALGATLHQIISGNDPSKTPFQFSPLSSSSKPFPKELEMLIFQMVEMDANKRPASASLIKKELQDIATLPPARSNFSKSPPAKPLAIPLRGRAPISLPTSNNQIAPIIPPQQVAPSRGLPYMPAALGHLQPINPKSPIHRITIPVRRLADNVMDNSSVWLISIAFLVCLALVIVITVNLYISNVLDDPNRPLNNFCNALNNGDYQAAYDELSPRWQSTMSEADFVQYMQQQQVVGCLGADGWLGDWQYTLTLNYACVPSCAGRVGVIIVQRDWGIWKIDKLDFNL